MPQEVVNNAPAPVILAFGAAAQAKFEYEYSGEVLTQAAAKRLLVKSERFYAWAGEQFGCMVIILMRSSSRH